jgi:hypothetical protein
MPKWRRNSEFGPGPRTPMDRESRAVFKAKLKLQRRPGRLTLACVQIGHILLEMLGATGQLDPSVETIATLACVNPSTVTRALAMLRDCGFVTWTRRLVRDATMGWRVEQTSNAYALTVPGDTDVQFARAVHFSLLRKNAPQAEQGDETGHASAARQLRLFGLPVPTAWGDV